MKYYRQKQVIAVTLAGVALFCCMDALSQRLKTVFPFNGQNKISVHWNKVDTAIEYQFRKKAGAGAYGSWTTTNLDTSFMDNAIAADIMYTYQVRHRKPDSTFSNPSNEKGNALQRIWPIRKKSDGVTESVEVLHGYGHPFQYGAALKYLHEGVDLHGESNVDNEVVRVPVGGIYEGSFGSAQNIVVVVRCWLDGDSVRYQFNHVNNVNANLVMGETVAPGDSLAVIQSGGAASWNTLKNHTHTHYWRNWATTAEFFSTTKNPFTIWDKNEYRDPQNKAPEIMDTNGDGEAVRFRKTPDREDYFEKSIVHNGVDIVAEVVDRQSSDAPWQNPKLVGYSIQKRENNAWTDAVRTAADPYILMDHANWYNSEGSNPNDKFIKTIVDYRDTVRVKPPVAPADYFFTGGNASAIWNHYFTYIVTNSKGTDGKEASVDSMQRFATDARKTVAEANGYVNNYAKARSIEEAKFPDGKYQVSIRMRDWVNAPADHKKEFMIDNFRPHVKKIEIKSDILNFMAEWKWDEATGTLKYEDNKDTAKACGKINIKVTTSEPMKKLHFEVPSLFYAKINTTPVANTDGKEWEFEIPEANTKDKPEGPHQILITGVDSADTQMQGFLEAKDVPSAGIELRDITGNWKPGNAPAKDKAFKFKLQSLKDKMSVATTDASACNKSDGKVTITVKDVKEELEYAVDSKAWQAGNEFKDLAIGEHEAKARIKGSKCETVQKFTIKEGNPLKVSVTGFGTTQFCDNANPPTVTLTASASGGSGKYVYSWPGGTLVVTGSGSYSVTVTDTVTGCKESKGGEVIFVPVVCSRDPNDIIGPEGYSPAKMVSKFQAQPYIIRFENDPDFATAPAQVVKINHKVDSTVNVLSLRLGDFGFGQFNFQVPPNKTYYSSRIDVRDSLGVVVDVTAGIDVDKKEAFWIFESKDPNTGLQPANSALGFLPVNDSTAIGEGYVMFTIRPANFTQTGDTIHAKAAIVFDINDPLETPQIFNTIDALAPVSKMKATADIRDSIFITLYWSGYDDAGGSGVRDYDLYVSENGSPFIVFQKGIKDTFAVFPGALGKTYSFFTLATDNTGNQENIKDAGEITIKLFGDGTLPVTWLYFKGMLHNKDVILNWSTAREINSKWYVIERALDGRNFTPIGQVNANGHTNRTSNYDYVDADAVSLGRKVLYYRLRQVNIDGTYSYSAVVPVAMVPADDAPIVRAYPNPFKQNITLQILNVIPSAGQDHVSLFTVDGKLIYQRKIGRLQNNTILLNDLPTLRSGTYLLKVIIKRSLYTLKMVRE